LNAFDNRPIAIFDSGLGGLSVLACALELLPDERFVYLADLANAPYGERPIEEIQALVADDINLLLAHDVKAVVVACNTATAASVAHLRELHPELPIIGMEPAAKVAAEHCGGKCAVLATPATLSLGMFKKLREQLRDQIQIVAVPCPGLSNMIDHDASPEELRDYLYELIDPEDSTFTSLVLGCTHYVLISKLVQSFYPNHSIISGNEGAVRHLANILQERKICAQHLAPEGDNRVQYLCTTADPAILDKMDKVTGFAKQNQVWINAFMPQNK